MMCEMRELLLWPVCMSSNSNVPFTVIRAVIDAINQMSASLSSFCRHEAVSTMISAGVDEGLLIP